MWDGRETFRDATHATGFATLPFDLADQSNAATLGHAQAAAPLTDAQRGGDRRLRDAALHRADRDRRAGGAGRARRRRAVQWPWSREAFYFGINDPLGGDPTGRPSIRR